jgi:flavin-dependent dehydrogenase
MSAVIVGGGPAGAAAALTLLDAQIPVTIVEREPFPRYRPGETLHPGVEPLLDKLGVAENLHAAEYVRHLGVWSGWGGSMQFIPYGEDSHGPWRGYQATRGDFDHWLLEIACNRGANLVAGHASGVLCNSSDDVAGVMTSVGPVRATYVIDCSGGSHTLARQLQIPIVRHSPQLVARFGYVSGCFDGPAPSICADKYGWTWVAEVKPNRFQWTRVTEAHNRPDPAWIPTGLRGLEAEPSRGADVTWRMAKTVAGPGYFLTGDSATVLDPSSSHGVLRAIMSGMMAAHLAVRHLCSGVDAQDCAAAYQDWLTRWFLQDVKEMSSAYRMANLFGFRG